MKPLKPTPCFRFQSPSSALTILSLALAVVGIGWLMMGCVPSAINPLYQPGDVVHDPALLGVWKDQPDGKERWTFTAGEGKGYTLEVLSENQLAVFDAHLFKLGDERFLDLYPVKSSLEGKLQNNPYGLALVPTHLFVWLRATAPSLRMSCMGLEWLAQELKRNPKALPHAVLPDDRVVFTAGTEAMQTFIKQHINKTDAWNELYGDGLVKVASDTKSK